MILIIIHLQKSYLRIIFDFVVTMATDPCGLTQPMVIDGELFGEITSKNYPLPYDNELDCSWHIHVEDGFVIQLTFPEFDVENG